MSSSVLSIPRDWSLQRRRQVGFIVLLLLELLALAYLGTRLIAVQVVEDYREIIGNQEIIHLKNEVAGDPILLALIVLGVLAPLALSQVRREPVLLLAVQASIIGLIVFVLWPLAQVFVEDLKRAEGNWGFLCSNLRSCSRSRMLRWRRSTP